MTSVKSATPGPGGEAGLHLAGIGLLLLALLLGVGGGLWLLARTAAETTRSGRFTAVFPPGLGAEARLAAVLRADALPVRESWLLGAIEVEAAAPGVAARLEAEGAVLVLPGLPSDLLASGGCSAGGLAAFPDRPALRKLRAGPM